jgi:thioredoxin:protein disulfide reductase
MIKNFRLLRLVAFLAITVSLFSPANAFATTVTPQGNIDIDNYFSANRAQRGRTIQAAIVLNIPRDLHINANRTLDRALIPTTLQVTAGNGVRVSAVSYPRAVLRRFSFSPAQLAVYENRAVLRFTLTVPANYQSDILEIQARVRYQACNDQVCFPPQTRQTSMAISVVGANDPVQRTNSQIFGGRRS